jgi:hypothetical protein
MRSNIRRAQGIGAADEQSGQLADAPPTGLGLKRPRVKGLESAPPVNVRPNDRVSLEQDSHREAPTRLPNRAKCLIPAGQAITPGKRQLW